MTKEEKKTKSQRAMEYVINKSFFFTDQFGQPHALIQIKDHDEVHSLNSRAFKQIVSGFFWDEEEDIITSSSLQSVILTLGAKAYSEGFSYELHNRVAWNDSAICYDLTNSKWEIVKITPEGWEVAKPQKPLFKRYTHQMPQVKPTTPMDLDKFIDLFKFKTDNDKLIVKVWVVTNFIPDIPHPLLVAFGPQGSTKSFLFKLMKKLVDPSVLLVLSFPKDRMELVQKISHHYFVPLDNVSYISNDFSDVLCRASTGEGISKRMLYTDEEDIIFSYKRPIGLNGINSAPTLPDLLDRSILVSFERLTKKERREEEELFKQFDLMKPKLLAYIFDVISKAMKIRKALHLKELPRMADFSRWGESISMAMGYPENAFLNAYYRNIDSLQMEVIEAHLIGAALLSFMEDKNKWEGKPNELLEHLETAAANCKINTNNKQWPKAPNTLMRKLNVLKTNLEEIGIKVDSQHTGIKRIVSIEKTVSIVKPLDSANTANKIQDKNNDTNDTNDICPTPDVESREFTGLEEDERGQGPCSYCGEFKPLTYKDSKGNELCSDCFKEEKGFKRKETVVEGVDWI